jgi:hypothetical protein
MEVIDMEEKLEEGQEKQEGEGLFERYTEETSKKRGRPKTVDIFAEEKNDLINITDNAIEFHDVKALKRYGEITYYTLSLDAETIGSLYKQNIIQYLGDIQRGYKIKDGNLVEIYKPSKVQAIMNSAIDNTLHGGTLIYNLEDKPENEIEFDEEKGILKITGILTIIDGNHRTKSCKKWTDMYNKGNKKASKSPRGYHFPIILHNVDKQRAASIFSELAITPWKISPGRAIALNFKDMNNQLINIVIEKSKLNGRVNNVSTTINNMQIITYNILYRNVAELFPITFDEQIEPTANFLISSIDKLISVFPAMQNILPEQRAEIRKQNMVIEKLTWSGYFKIIKTLAGRDDLIEQLNKFNNEIKIGDWSGKFLDRTNPALNSIMRGDGKVVSTSSTQKIMTKLMYEFIIEDKIEGYEFEVIE